MTIVFQYLWKTNGGMVHVFIHVVLFSSRFSFRFFQIFTHSEFKIHSVLAASTFLITKEQFPDTEANWAEVNI